MSSPAFRILSLPKTGNHPDENEDAAFARPDDLRFAVADGASEGWQSGPWARHLAGAYVANPPDPDTFADWLAGVRRTFMPPAAAGPVPWYAEAKQAQGSYATLAGVQFVPTDEAWLWNGVAVGDSCLIHVCGGRMELSFPITDQAGFGTRPALVQSQTATSPVPLWRDGRAAPGDLFLLATDSVAAYLLAAASSDDWLSLIDSLRTDLALDTEGGLADVLAAAQTRHNDDASLVVVQLAPLTDALL